MIPQEGSNPSMMVSIPAYDHWTCQDQLLLHGIMFSATKSFVPFFVSAEISIDA